MRRATSPTQRLRERSEHVLRFAALAELGRGQPGTVKAAPAKGDLLWRLLFVPLYRRIPWPVKQRAMAALRMTATGWEPPARRPGTPWRPPAQAAEETPPH